MTYVRSKEIPPGSGNYYDYLVRSVRVGKKVKQEHIEYLGPSGMRSSDKKVVKGTYWPGDPEGHSEAAKLGWAKRQARSFLGENKGNHWEMHTRTGRLTHSEKMPGGTYLDPKPFNGWDLWYSPQISYSDLTKEHDSSIPKRFVFATITIRPTNKGDWEARAFYNVYDKEKKSRTVKTSIKIPEYFNTSKDAIEYLKKNKGRIEMEALLL